MERDKLKYTKTDRKRQKQTEMETAVINGQKWTEMTETDKNRQRCGEGRGGRNGRRPLKKKLHGEGTDTQTHTQMDKATYRLNYYWGRCSENPFS